MVQPSLVEVTVARLGIDSGTNAYVVVLRERDGDRILPIWIGRPEAESIVMQMNHVTHERPLTHDLCKVLITGMGGTLRRVNITHVRASTYYAALQVEGPRGIVEFDARPSDSIAIALRLSAPIFADESLLSEFDEDDDDDGASEDPSGSSSGTPPWARSRESSELAADELKAYLERLRPEDFGKFQP
ncbi:bifunctional nuclease family protein [Gemmatimonas aurantiaca]|uniref:bifunctional nuclease family protein n=1 Tax=Gemmatimonas aurantiaca TaxID=173480 RepID=UPI00301BDF11